MTLGRLLREFGVTKAVMLHAQMSCRPYGWSPPQAYDGGRPQRGNTNAGAGSSGRITIVRTAQRTILDFARKVFASREMIVRPQRAWPSEWRHCKRIGLS